MSVLALLLGIAALYALFHPWKTLTMFGSCLVNLLCIFVVLAVVLYFIGLYSG